MSELAYLPIRIVSPALTVSAWRFPSSESLPLPTEITSASSGFSFALSG